MSHNCMYFWLRADCRTYLSVSEFESYSKVAAVANFDSGDIPWPENEVELNGMLFCKLYWHGLMFTVDRDYFSMYSMLTCIYT